MKLKTSRQITIIIICALVSVSCTSQVKTKHDFNREMIDFSELKYKRLIDSNLNNISTSFINKELLDSTKKAITLFRYNLQGANIRPLEYSVKMKKDSSKAEGNISSEYFTESLKIKYEVSNGQKKDTILSTYISRIIAKNDQSQIFSIINRDDDPLYFNPTPDVKMIVNKAYNTTEKNTRVFTYDRTAAKSYAKKHWNSPNAAFCNYDGVGGDCTNFVSQCLNAGGWIMTNDWKARGAGCCDNILNCSIQNCYTCSWTVANQFFLWLQTSGRIESSSYSLKDLEIGDIIQQDIPFPNTNIDHTMIVTDKIGDIPYVTYRSAGAASERDLVPANTIRGTLYCWHVKNTF